MINIPSSDKVSDKILKKVNENIYYIIELFSDICKGVEEKRLLAEVFPEHLYRKDKERCLEIIDELEEYTRDSYVHNLTPIHEYALFHLLEWWTEVNEINFTQEISENEIKSDIDKDISDNINNIDEYKSIMFSDWDFLEYALSNYIEIYQKQPNTIINVLNVDLDKYVEIMPDDKKEEYFKAKKKIQLLNTNLDVESRKIINDRERLIIKCIYNAIKLVEKNPYRLQKTSETELSDDISNSVIQKLHDNNLVFAREMPNGMAKKGIGECDFYIHTYEGDVYKIIAIGENKEWGNFERQLKQLLGYMNSNTEFGFTIIFNKKTKLSTVLEKRKNILENFSVEVNREKHFEVIGGIKELKNMPDVLLTLHGNPEKEDSYFRMYHFIVNTCLKEREETANQARRDK